MNCVLALCLANALGMAVTKPRCSLKGASPLVQCCECDRLRRRAVSDKSLFAQTPQGSRGQRRGATRPPRCAISRSTAVTLGTQRCSPRRTRARAREGRSTPRTKGWITLVDGAAAGLRSPSRLRGFAGGYPQARLDVRWRSLMLRCL